MPTRTRPANMLAPHRHREILAALESNGSVRVTNLARRLGVTEETIRRDLEKLGAEGLLVRIHGGAISVNDERQDIPFEVRKATNLAQKRAIAQRAVEMIHEGDVIALDASTTALELARLIPDMPITVVTNALSIVSALLDRKLVKVVSTGGQLDSDSACFVGSMAEAGLARFSLSRVFLSCKGVDLERGLSEANDEHASIKKSMLDLADRVYLLADHSKFALRSMVFFAQASAVDTLITDAGTEASVIAACESMGVEVEVAD